MALQLPGLPMCESACSLNRCSRGGLHDSLEVRIGSPANPSQLTFQLHVRSHHVSFDRYLLGTTHACGRVTILEHDISPSCQSVGVPSQYTQPSVCPGCLADPSSGTDILVNVIILKCSSTGANLQCDVSYLHILLSPRPDLLELAGPESVSGLLRLRG